MSNKVSAVPFYDILKQLKNETYKELRVCLPGSISGVDIATGTVSVTIGVMQKVAQEGLPTGLSILYPQLTMCPVFTTQGGGVGAVMPVTIGDECLVVFSDRCIDSWFTTGQPMPLPSVRMHDISDGFVLVGLNSQANPLITSLLSSGEGGLCETAASAPMTGAKVVIDPLTHKISISNGIAGVNSLFLILTTAFAALAADPALSPTTQAALLAANTALATLLY